MKKEYLHLLALILILQLSVISKMKGQQSSSLYISEIISEIIQEIPEEADLDEIEEMLLQLSRKPISLNKGTPEEFEQIFFLNRDQVKDIFDYRTKYQGFRSIYELATIESLDAKTLRWLLPFITIQSVATADLNAGELLSKGKSELLLKTERVLEKQKGYLISDSAGGFTGSPEKVLIRYTYAAFKSASFNITAEKDAGEAFSFKRKAGFDFLSAHLALSGKGLFRRFIIGDYHAGFGQGVVFRSGFSLGKSPDVLNIFRSGPVLRPFRSTAEYGYLRGAAATFAIKNLQLTTFLSYIPIDAITGIADSGSGDTRFISSFYSTGLHRTLKEMETKNTIKQSIAGFHGALKYTRLDIGFSGIYGHFSSPFLQKNSLNDKYDFYGSDFTTTGIDFSYTYKNFHFFGEIGYDLQSTAVLAGGSLKISSELSTAAVFRYFPKNYHALFANAFRENTLTQNEKGFYWAIHYIPAKYWVVSAYTDIFSFPWLKYQINLPSYGREYRIKISHSKTYKIYTYLMYSYSQKLKNLSGTEFQLKNIVETERSSLRWDIRYYASNHLSLMTRAEVILFSENTAEDSRGYLTFQDISYRLSSIPISLVFRYAVFNSPDYDTRVYAFENDLITSFSIPSYYGIGSRYYLMLEFPLSKSFLLQARYSRTDYSDRESISSGLTEISKAHKSDIKFLIRYRF